MPNHIKAEALRDFIRLTKQGISKKYIYDGILLSLGVRRLLSSSLKPSSWGEPELGSKPQWVILY